MNISKLQLVHRIPKENISLSNTLSVWSLRTLSDDEVLLAMGAMKEWDLHILSLRTAQLSSKVPEFTK